MKELNIDELLEKIPNKYVLTVTVSKRARQIFEELKFLKTVAKDPLILAMEEVVKGKITFKEEEEGEV
jgi:DNA-directed RNA polymerase subunit omega|uniref:DNA-directed RNA polymerase subunit omega n=1 Tax=Dictyoglomus turgidum TaxID=513050 RepID=A0A7C3SNA0_9BACT